MRTSLLWDIKQCTVAILFRLFETDTLSSYSDQYNVPLLETSRSKERIEGAFSFGPERTSRSVSGVVRSFVGETVDEFQEHCNHKIHFIIALLFILKYFSDSCETLCYRWDRMYTKLI